MNDVTTRVLDELNTIPGTTPRPGLSRFDGVKPFIYDFVQRYCAEDFDEVAAKNDAELFDYVQTLDKRMLHFDSDTQEKPVLFSSIEDDSINPQTILFTENTTQPDFETIILERDGDVYPKLIAVSVPRSMDLSAYSETGGMPFHIFFHPTLGQNTASYYTAVNMPGRESLKDTIDQKYAPYGWDFLFYIVLRNLLFQGSTNKFDNGRMNEWAGKGLLYQIANSGKNIINVIPILDVQKNAGDFEKPELLLQILKEIQQTLIIRAGVESNELLPAGHTALSAFSSGHLCMNNLMQAAHTTQNPEFFGDVLQEVYMFDPPAGTNDISVRVTNGWATTYGAEKVVRIYTQWVPANGGLLLSPDQPMQQSKLVLNSGNSNRSFALLGEPYFRDKLGGSDWQAIHQAIPALMLNDALSRSQF